MPLDKNPGEDKNAFISRCIKHYVNKGRDQKQAAAICYMDWKQSLHIRKPKILFGKDIPDFVIKQFTDKYEVHIWSGSKYYWPTKSAFKLAKASGVNLGHVHFGTIDVVLKQTKYEAFITNEDKYKDVDGYCEFINPDGLTLSKVELAAPVIQSRWNTRDSNACPICVELASHGWVDIGTSMPYDHQDYPNGVQMPPYRQAHSIIGRGLWKVGDDKCRCSIDYRVKP